MNATKTYIIECSRSTSTSSTQSGQKSASNARWTNRVNFNLEIGDRISMNNAIIHNTGESSDGTIEISGENDLVSGLKDNIIGLKFVNYICDNGYNTLKLPYVGTLQYNGNISLDYTPVYEITGVDNVNNDWQVGDDFTLGSLNYKGIVKTVKANGGGNLIDEFEMDGDNWQDWFDANVDAGGLPFLNTRTQDYTFVTGIAPLPDKLPTDTTTLHGFKCIGTTINSQVTDNNGKYMDPNYGMPLREEGYNFQFSYEENDTPQIVAPNSIYTSYSLPYHQNNADLKMCVNGEKYTKLQTNYRGCYRSNWVMSEEGATFYSGEDDLYPLYSEVVYNIDAPAYEAPTTITNRMNIKLHETDAQNEGSILPVDENGNVMPHVSGSLNKVISANGHSGNFWGEIAVRDLNKWKGIHSMMRCELAFGALAELNSTNEKYFFPRPCILMNGALCENQIDDLGQDPTACAFYPRKALPFQFKVKGKTDPVISECAYSTLPKYFVVVTNIRYTAKNIERIKVWFENNEVYDGQLTDPTSAQSDVENWRVMADLGSSRDGVNTTNVRTTDPSYMPDPSYYRYLSSGKPDMGNLVQGYNSVSNCAYSIPIDPYNIEDVIDNFGKHVTSPRSDYLVKNTVIYVGSEKLEIDEIEIDVPHRFSQNKEKNTSMALFSRMLPDYGQKMRISNVEGEPEDDGDGKYKHDPLGRGIDVSLSGSLGVYGVEINQQYDGGGQEIDKVCAFMLYADSATKAGNNWIPSTSYALPSIFQGMFFGCSPSFIDNPAVWCVNNMSTNTDVIGASKNSQNFVSIGANDPTIEFDGTQSRTVLKQLHTQRQLGINEMPSDGEGNFVTTTLGEDVIKFGDGSFTFQKFDNVASNNTRKSYVYQTPRNGGLSTSTSGLFIDSVYGTSSNIVPTSTGDMVEMVNDTDFYNSLLYKLGFVRSDLFSVYGQPWNSHTPSLVGDYTQANRYKQVKPLTTNAQMSISSQPDFSVMDSSNDLPSCHTPVYFC